MHSLDAQFECLLQFSRLSQVKNNSNMTKKSHYFQICYSYQFSLRELYEVIISSRVWYFA